ncbi:hypothetical protein BZL54_08120 [Burkholderia ubonensis subsp. mesacidophila]|uniref:Crocagin biosynthetic protein CgnE/B domain-containing protein n=2 Tax=Burkholderia ubonensis TaxID=101571 RepID=A0A2A4FII7_9BURK|nr:hypothetical protein BZL54_08120 [Burkholderia ubonensis subsp. mesacidophila]
MLAGWLYSIAEFFEASIVNLNKDRPSFAVDGTFSFDGLIYLCNNATLKRKYYDFFNEMMLACSHGENRIDFSDNTAQTIVIGGSDVTREFREMFCGLERGLAATEFALGCADYDRPVDWGINSLLNEGVRGAHIGIGMGAEMPHIDFISTHAKLR